MFCSINVEIHGSDERPEGIKCSGDSSVVVFLL